MSKPIINKDLFSLLSDYENRIAALERLHSDPLASGAIAYGAITPDKAALGPEIGLKIIRGIVNTASTTPVEGFGFSVSLVSTGRVTVTFSTPFSDIPVIVAMNVAVGETFLASAASESAFTIQLATSAGAAAAGIFHFVAIGPS